MISRNLKSCDWRIWCYSSFVHRAPYRSFQSFWWFYEIFLPLGEFLDIFHLTSLQLSQEQSTPAGLGVHANSYFGDSEKTWFFALKNPKFKHFHRYGRVGSDHGARHGMTFWQRMPAGFSFKISIFVLENHHASDRPRLRGSRIQHPYNRISVGKSKSQPG